MIIPCTSLPFHADLYCLELSIHITKSHWPLGLWGAFASNLQGPAHCGLPALCHAHPLASFSFKASTGKETRGVHPVCPMRMVSAGTQAPCLAWEFPLQDSGVFFSLTSQSPSVRLTCDAHHHDRVAKISELSSQWTVFPVYLKWSCPHDPVHHNHQMCGSPSDNV